MPVPERIYAAALDGELDVLREYFASGDRDPNDVVARNGWTLLDGACFGNTEGTRGRRVISCEAISFLLSQGASVDFQDPGGTWHRPLVVAATSCSTNDAPYRRDEEEMCASLKLLIDAGADINAGPGVGAAEGFTALMQAVVKNNLVVVRFLLRHGATLDAGIEARRARTLSQCQLHGLSPAATRREVDEQTLEDWCRLLMRGPAETYNRGPMLNFLTDVRASGGTVKKFLWAPRGNLCMLRLLCEQGRAAPRLGQVSSRMARPRVVDRLERDLLERVFAWAPGHATDSRRRTRSAQAAVRASHITPLPRGVFKLVLSFWESKRDWWWYRVPSARYGDSNYGSWD